MIGSRKVSQERVPLDINKLAIQAKQKDYSPRPNNKAPYAKSPSIKKRHEKSPTKYKSGLANGLVGQMNHRDGSLHEANMNELRDSD